MTSISPSFSLQVLTLRSLNFYKLPFPNKYFSLSDQTALQVNIERCGLIGVNGTFLSILSSIEATTTLKIQNTRISSNNNLDRNLFVMESTAPNARQTIRLLDSNLDSNDFSGAKLIYLYSSGANSVQTVCIMRNVASTFANGDFVYAYVQGTSTQNVTYNDNDFQDFSGDTNNDNLFGYFFGEFGQNFTITNNKFINNTAPIGKLFYVATSRTNACSQNAQIRNNQVIGNEAATAFLRMVCGNDVVLDSNIFRSNYSPDGSPVLDIMCERSFTSKNDTVIDNIGSPMRGIFQVAGIGIIEVEQALWKGSNCPYMRAIHPHSQARLLSITAHMTFGQPIAIIQTDQFSLGDLVLYLPAGHPESQVIISKNHYLGDILFLFQLFDVRSHIDDGCFTYAADYSQIYFISLTQKAAIACHTLMEFDANLVGVQLGTGHHLLQPTQNWSIDSRLEVQIQAGCVKVSGDMTVNAVAGLKAGDVIVPVTSLDNCFQGAFQSITVDTRSNAAVCSATATYNTSGAYLTMSPCVPLIDAGMANPVTSSEAIVGSYHFRPNDTLPMASGADIHVSAGCLLLQGEIQIQVLPDVLPSSTSIIEVVESCLQVDGLTLVGDFSANVMVCTLDFSPDTTTVNVVYYSCPSLETLNTRLQTKSVVVQGNYVLLDSETWIVPSTRMATVDGCVTLTDSNTLSIQVAPETTAGTARLLLATCFTGTFSHIVVDLQNNPRIYEARVSYISDDLMVDYTGFLPSLPAEGRGLTTLTGSYYHELSSDWVIHSQQSLEVQLGCVEVYGNATIHVLAGTPPITMDVISVLDGCFTGTFHAIHYDFSARLCSAVETYTTTGMQVTYQPCAPIVLQLPQDATGVITQSGNYYTDEMKVSSDVNVVVDDGCLTLNGTLTIAVQPDTPAGVSTFIQVNDMCLEGQFDNLVVDLTMTKTICSAELDYSVPAQVRVNYVACPTLSGGAIAGIVIGCVAFVVILAALTWYFAYYRPKMATSDP